MPKYHVSLIVDATVCVTVDAANEKEAIEKAFGEADAFLRRYGGSSKKRQRS